MMSKLMVFLLMLALLGAPKAAVSQTSKPVIDWPGNGTRLPQRPCLKGTTAQPGAVLEAVVHPTEWSDYFVQPRITAGPDGKFRVAIYLGDAGLHAGKHFEVGVFSNPKVADREGDVLGGWPEAEASSDVIEVVRDDNKPSGCDLSAAVTGPIVGQPPVARSNVIRTPEPAVPATDRTGQAKGWVPALAALLVFLAMALIAMPERAAAALGKLDIWLEAYGKWLTEMASGALQEIAKLWRWLLALWTTSTLGIWTARGFSGDLRAFALRLLLVGPLQLASLLALYGEASTIVKGLNPTFGIESVSTENRGGSGLFSATTLADGKPTEGAAASEEPSGGGSVVVRAANWAFRPFATLWKSEKLGFLAICLACLQAGFGIVLLWQMGTSQPLRLRPLALLQDRLLLTISFLTLNLALSILAANRGFEHADDGARWVMPSVISGLIALGMPWILALTQHYAFECAADCFCVFKAIALIAAAAVAGLATMAGWVLLLTAGLALAAIGFAAYFAFFLPASGLLLFAELLGGFVRLLPWPSLGNAGPQWRAFSTTAASLALAGATYYLLRGLAQ